VTELERLAMERNDIVDDFEAVDQHGHTVTLSEMLSYGPVVLFFYPKAMTGGCTAESCHFRNLRVEFARYGAQPVGVSADSIEQQAQFDQANSLGFPLLSDPNRRIAAQFGVRRPGPMWNRRKTFVIDRDRRVVEVIGSELNMETHADQALDALAEMQSAALN
jgi:peroxiredoxin Q/BCP